MNIAALNVKIGADIASFNRSMDAVTKKIRDTKKKMQSLSDVGRGLQSVGTSLSVGLTLPIVALGAASLKTFGNIQALKKGLEAVMGSAEAAESEFKKLIQVAKLPGLGLEEAARGSVSLQSAGFSADQARKSLLAFGNALATVGKGKAELNYVILALTQLQNKTSGYGQDLRQLTEQLPQLRGALKNAFGTSNSEEIAQLGYTGSQVVQMITDEFAKIPKVTGGINNAFENLSDSIKISMSTIGEELNKAFDVEGKLNALGTAVSKITTAFSNLSDGTKKVIFIITGLVAALGPALVIFGGIIALIPSLVAGFAVLQTSLIPAIASIASVALPVIAIIAAIAALSAAIYGIVKASDKFGIAFKRVWLEVKGYVANAVLSMLRSIDEFAESFNINLGLDGAIKSVQKFADANKKALDTTPLVTFKDAEDAMRDSVINAFNGMKKKVSDFFTEARAEVEKTVESTVNGMGKISRIPIVPMVVPFQAKQLNTPELNIGSTGLDALTQVSAQMEVATQKSLVFGESFDLISEKTNILKSAISNLIDNGFSASSGAVQAMISQLKRLGVAMDDIKTKSVEVGSIIKTSVSGAVAGFAEQLGKSIGSGQSFFDGLLTIVADFVGQFGKMLISAGVAALAFEQLLISPPAAIAAGAALVAISAAIKGHLSNGMQGHSGVGSVSSSGGSNFSAGYDPGRIQAANNTERLLVARVTGSDLDFVLEEYYRKEGRVGG